MTIEVNDKNFDEQVVQSDKLVLVDFWAEWCGPCRMLSPTIEKIAGELKGRLLTVKVNVDQKPHVASQYNIRSIPTVMLFHRGQGIMRMMGAQPYEVLKAEIIKHLS